MQPSIKMFFKARQPCKEAQSNMSPASSERRSELMPEKSETPVTPAKRSAEDESHKVVKRRQTYSSPVITPAKTYTEKKHCDDIENGSIQHAHLSYQFLYPPNRRDIAGRSPDDPEYDDKTIHIPNSFLDAQTPALRQWWLIKQKNMDAILFFKMGKFYELFNEDAVTAVNNLDIMYMKGDETKPAHAGFPEISYEKYAKILIDKGFKVIRIEQTETPAMMEERCQQTGRRGKFDKVVKREVCRITTKGTQMLGVCESVFHSVENQYLLVLCESSYESENSDDLKVKSFGVCFIDVTVGKMYLGEFIDDHNHSRLNILLAHKMPTEVLYERGNLNPETHQALLKTGAVLNVLRPNKEFWPIKKALSHLKVHHIFQDEDGNFEWPSFLMNLFEEGESSDSPLQLEPKENYKLALHCFGALVYYLQSQMILSQVLQCVTFEFYTTPLEKPNEVSKGLTQVPPMILDHIALRNLEIFENSAGGTFSTLYESINYCKTHFGQRLLRNWVCSPLRDIKLIENRLDAVQDLISNDNASLVNEFVHVLGQTPDLERMLSKIKSQCFRSEGDERAIMFDGDQHSKAKINSFLTLLNNFKRLRKFISSIKPNIQDCKSEVLKRLLSFTTDGGLFPDYGFTIDYFETAFDHDVAKKTGKIIPAPGVDKRYDSCQASIDRIKDKLNEYLEEQKEIINCKHIEYFGTAKNRYQIQVPEPYCKKVPSEYRIETTRKGVKRYYTETIVKLFQKLMVLEEEMKKTLEGIMSTIFAQFSRKIKLWSAAIDCVAVLDVLQSIASFVKSLKANNVDVCRPKFIEVNTPSISYVNGRHPALVKLDPNFTPNNLKLDEKLILLSGANMGGKSTLMRQTALLVILAQIGCFVPASSMTLTPVDRIFSRLGASDRLIEGESTFYTELVETSTMLRYATRLSLLLLDELGRGTSTFDGTAIAYSVIREISNNIKCPCLFSTHYHTLVRDFENVDNVRLAHMACSVKKDSDDSIDLNPLKENITFLYKITEGSVERSYGFNVAKLAGIQDSIIIDAFEKAKELELSCKILDTLQSISKRGHAQIGGDKLREEVLKAVRATEVAI